VESLIGHDGIETLIALGQVVFINVVLSADNAVVIGMAAMGLAAKDRLRVLWLGIALATLMRIGFAVVATELLQVLGLLLAGGVLLLWVAWRLWRELRRTADPGQVVVAATRETKSLGRALWQIIVADISMSLDNVLAVAGAAIDKPAVMAAGLAISVLLMGIAAAAVARLLERFRWIAYVGLAIILFISVKMVWHGTQDIASAAAFHWGYSNGNLTVSAPF
jgi:YjbE family integral membrane protein